MEDLFIQGVLYGLIFYFFIDFIIIKKNYVLYFMLAYIVEILAIEELIVGKYLFWMRVISQCLFFISILNREKRYSLYIKREKIITIILNVIYIMVLYFGGKEISFRILAIFLHLINISKTQYIGNLRELELIEENELMYNEAKVLNESYKEELNENSIISYRLKDKMEENELIYNELKVMNEYLEEKVFIRTKELEEKNKILENISKRDSLTGLYNHKYIYDYLEKCMEKSKEGGDISVIMFDIDHFKMVNDKFGHVTGDEVIYKIAKMLEEEVDEKYIKGRYGGEEYLVVLCDCELREAVEIADKIREHVGKLKFNEKELQVTISGGVAKWCGERSIELIDRADTLLYQAKSGGRDRIES